MDAFNLKATVSLDSSDYDKGLNNAQKKLASFGGSLSSFGSKVASGFATAAKVTTAAVAAGSAAVAGLTKVAVSNYAEYEQLVGGAQLMFGDAFDSVMEKSQNAYKTVQMSQNDYLTQVNGFATGLKTALGGNEQAAADLADKIITAEADVVAATGNSQEAVQNAFNGIMKSNYMMLDNLQLGITPTKAGMQEVIDKVNEWNAAQGNLTHYTIDNLADQQAALVDYIEMVGVAGYAQNEAADTIQGSLSSLKASWENLLTGLADPKADIGILVTNMLNSAEVAFNNILPIIEQSLVSIGEFISKIAPVVAEKIPGLISEVAPPLIDAAWQMVTTLGTALTESVPQLLGYINGLLGQIADAIGNFDFAGEAGDLAVKIGEMFGGDNVLSQIIAKGGEIISSLVSGIGQALPQLLPAAMDVISSLINDLTQQIPQLISAAVDLIVGLAEGLTNPTSLSNMLTSALNLIMKLAEGLINNIPKITATVPQIIENLMQTIARLAPRLLMSALQLIVQLEIGLIKNIPTLLAAVPQIIGSLVLELINGAGELIRSGAEMIENVKQGFESLNPAEWGRDLIDSFVEGIKNSIGKVVSAAKEVASTVKDYLGFSEPELGPLSNFHTYAPDMMKLFAQGIKDNTNIVANQMEKSFALPDMSNDISGSTNSVTGGNVTINVYGAEGQSEKLLAEEVADLLLHDFNMKQAVWGTA